MIALLLTAALCAHPSRSRQVIEDFKSLHPCPASCATYTRKGPGRYRVYQACGACQVDHRCPRAWCGRDDAGNLQWLSAKENRQKSDDPGQCTYEDVDWSEIDRLIADRDAKKAAVLRKLRAELEAIVSRNSGVAP